MTPAVRNGRAQQQQCAQHLLEGEEPVAIAVDCEEVLLRVIVIVVVVVVVVVGGGAAAAAVDEGGLLRILVEGARQPLPRTNVW